MAPPAPPGTTGLECSTSFHEGSKLARLCATSCCRGATSRCIVVDGVPIILVSVYICHITDWCEEIMLTEHVSLDGKVGRYRLEKISVNGMLTVKNIGQRRDNLLLSFT